jgi:hypothetical protein
MRPDEFGRRRRQLMRHMGRDGIAILPAAPVRMRINDIEDHYRQDSDFYYLTGFAEPEAVAVLMPGRPQGEYVLFVRDRDPAREAWDGARAGPEGAVRDFAADDAFPVGDIDEILPGLLERRARVFYTMGAHPEFDTRVIGWINQLRSQGTQGNRTPHTDPHSRGAIMGLSLNHTRAHVYRAMMEGVAFGTELIFETMRANGFEQGDIVICGGATRSDLWMQIHADVSGVPLILTEVPDAATLGSAILAAVGGGAFASIPEAAGAMVHRLRVVEPDMARYALYRPIYERYKRAYQAMKVVG